jgi:hypothetical protein
LETFTDLRGFTENPQYQSQKQKTLCELNDDMIDMPVVGLINGFNELPYCFTLQSCYGHFVYNGQNDSHNLDPLPTEKAVAKVEYRIAYISFCIENSAAGRSLSEALKEIPTIDQNNIQFCCAEWFWERQINSFPLQVVPDRFKRNDTAILEFNEALQIEKIRNTFFIRLYELLENCKRKLKIG